MTLIAYMTFFVGFCILVYIVLTRKSDFIKGHYRSLVDILNIKKELANTEYEYEVTISDDYHYEYTDFYAKSERLRRNLKIQEQEIQILSLKSQSDHNSELAKLQLEKMRQELAKGEAEIKFYMLLDRARAKTMANNSKIDYERWKKFESYIDTEHFANKRPMVQAAILNALSNNMGVDNISELHANVDRELRNQKTKESLRADKMKNDFEQKKNAREF